MSARRRLTVAPDQWQPVLDPVTGERSGELYVVVVINTIPVQLVLLPIGRLDRDQYGGHDQSPELRLRTRRYHLVVRSA